MTIDRWRKLSIKESHVQRSVLDYLAAEGILAIRLNAGEAKRGGRRIALAPAGTPDIVAQIPRGRRVQVGFLDCWGIQTFPVAIICWIECKRFKGGKWTTEQKPFKQRAAEEGAFYILAQSVDDVMRAIPPKNLKRI